MLLIVSTILLCFGLLMFCHLIVFISFLILIEFGQSSLFVVLLNMCIYSKEGVTQCDPLSMFLYAIARYSPSHSIPEGP